LRELARTIGGRESQLLSSTQLGGLAVPLGFARSSCRREKMFARRFVSYIVPAELWRTLQDTLAVIVRRVYAIRLFSDLLRIELKARAELELKARAELELKARAELERALHLLGFHKDRKNALHPVTSCRRFCKRPTPTTPTQGNY